ncbi:MAG: hypothetical protein ABR878_00690 [Roseiarcus sp.]
MTIGTLFTAEFLDRGLPASPAWNGERAPDSAAIEAQFRLILDAVKDRDALNEAQTEERIFRPMLRALGWDRLFTVQENIEARGRANVPDYAYFPDTEAFALADAARTPEGKFPHAIAIGDAKAWSVDFEAPNSGSRPGETAVGQTIRYLERAKIQSNRKAPWAILANGRVWRLYYADAKSALDGYFEADLAEILALPGTQAKLAPLAGEGDEDRRARLFKAFVLAFRPEAFRPDPELDGRSFLEFALAEGARWETKVRTDLSEVVFRDVFPGLIRGLAAADKKAPAPFTPAYLEDLRDAALTVLYRLLSALYAEDRDLLPAHDRKYDAYSLSAVRDDIAARLDAGTEPSQRRTNWWDRCVGLFRTIDEGDEDAGVPPYNGGLFARDRAPIVERAELSDNTFGPLLDKLSRTKKDGRLVRINFRDLSVRELGAIYERLLEFEPVVEANAPGGLDVRPNPFSRKSSGSYYTPDELVSLIIARTVGPLVDERIEAFRKAAERPARDKRTEVERLRELAETDPASRILDLKICDPAMGSGHFLVSLIDYLAVRVVTAIGEASAIAGGDYASPLPPRLAGIRDRIRAEAMKNKWTIREAQLTDQNLIKRMALKRCVYGVDKNPMAVELAKVALWLHTFAAGAPLSFLDHHLRCGDSLFGERVRAAIDELRAESPLLLNKELQRAEGAIKSMEFVERLTDSDISEVKASADRFAEVEGSTAPLNKFLSFRQAIKWLQPLHPATREEKAACSLEHDEAGAYSGLMAGSFGDPIAIVAGQTAPSIPEGQLNAEQRATMGRRTVALHGLIERADALIAQERFLHWEVAFPGVWHNWQSDAPEGGFDAVISNPPWDRMKMQEVEWFAARAPQVAKQARAADRKRMIAALKEQGDPLAAAYDLASARAEQAMERARKSGDYPLLSRGDINLYSLFVERAQALVKPSGAAGLLTPSGIASDLTASAFFKGVASAGRVLSLFDFENRRGEGREAFFPDVDSRFKFCAFVVGGAERASQAADCAFFLRDPPERAGPDKLFLMTAADFALVNPNTGAAPIFRTRRDAELTTAIYRRLPVLVDRSSGAEVKAWPVKYLTMLHMTNDSHLFWTRERLEQHGAYPVELGRWKKGAEEWVPLYQGKMIQAFDHRAADVVVNARNLHRPAQREPIDENGHANVHRFATPQYWVDAETVSEFGVANWVLGFKEIASATNERTMIAALLPAVGFGNKTPILIPEATGRRMEWMLAADLNSFVHDFVARQKLHGQTLNRFIVEQLPVVPPAAYARAFGPKTAETIVRDHVLRLTYTAWDMQPFAREMGYDGAPFVWRQDERRHWRARLDALYFHLYGIADEDEIRYILSTFPIVERKDRAAHDGVYLTAELIRWYSKALGAGDPETQAPEAAILRNAGRAT